MHAPSTEAARYIAQPTLENFKQGFKIDLDEHMILFRRLKDQLILSGGTATSEDLGRRLIHSLHNNHKALRQHLLRTVRPITYSGVEDEIKLMNNEEKASEANEVNANSVFEGNSTVNLQSQKGKSNFKTKPKCTSTECVGQHNSDLCWAKPKNFPTRHEKWTKIIQARKWQGQIPTHLQHLSQGLKTSNAATCSSNQTSLNISSNKILELTKAMNELKSLLSTSHITALNCDWTCSNSAISSSIPSGDWGLHDTGASHHMFNDQPWFEAGTLIKNKDPSRWLTLAGGKDSPSVHSIGIVELFDTQKDKVELHAALFVPSLNKNLIAGGALIKKGIQTVIDDTNKDIFTMKTGNQGLFNGFFHGNLMILKLDKFNVSPITKSMDGNAETDSLLTIHKRLGHANK